MADELPFPRLGYKGEPDTLGTGMDASGRQLDSQTKRFETKEDFAAAQKDGWRLDRDDPKAVQAAKDQRARDKAEK